MNLDLMIRTFTRVLRGSENMSRYEHLPIYKQAIERAVFTETVDRGFFSIINIPLELSSWKRAWQSLCISLRSTILPSIRGVCWARDWVDLVYPHFLKQPWVGVLLPMMVRSAQHYEDQGREVLIVRATDYPLWTLWEHFPKLLLKFTSNSISILHQYGNYSGGYMASNGGII